jgi:hypothetical protein
MHFPYCYPKLTWVLVLLIGVLFKLVIVCILFILDICPPHFNYNHIRLRGVERILFFLL